MFTNILKQMMQEIPKQPQAFNIGLTTNTSAKKWMQLGQIVFAELDSSLGEY